VQREHFQALTLEKGAQVFDPFGKHDFDIWSHSQARKLLSFQHVL
jgi:hypothetical protein